MRRNPWAIGIAICLVSVTSVGWANEVAPDGSQIVTHGRNDRIYVVQCGLDTTIFALEYFHIKYPLDKVSLGLPFTEEGIALSDIGAILSAFGLEVEARKSVSVRQLTKALSPDTLAIIPLKVGQESAHYFVAALDNHRHPVFLNPGGKVVPLQDGLIQNKFDELGGLAMFVRRKKGSRAPMSEQVAIVPKSIELGEFLVNGPGHAQKLSVSLSVQNTSDLPIMVSSVQQSCGCTELDWKGGLLQPGEKHAIQFSVLPGSWGAKAREKMILFTFGDGSFQRIAIRGKGVKVEEKQRIAISQNAIRVDVTEKQQENTIDVRVARVTMFGPSLKSLSVTTEADWLSPRVVATDTKSGELWAKIDRNRAIEIMMEKSSNRVMGELVLSTNGDLEPARVQVAAIRRDAFHVEPGFLRMTANDSRSHRLLVCANNQGTQVKVVKVKSLPSGLSADVFNRPEECGLEIRVKDSGAVISGFYDVIFVVEYSKGMQGTARVPVQLIP